MKIKTQFWWSLATAGIVALLAAVAVGWALRAQAEAELQQRHAQATAREIAGLLVLTQEYARGGDQRAAQQWWSRHSRLSAELSSPRRQASTFDPGALQETASGLSAAFSRLMDVAEEPPSPLGERRRELLVDQLLTDAQVLADGAFRWSRDAAVAQAAAERQLQRVGVAAFAVMVGLLLVQGLLVRMAVLRPLARIQAATEALGQGDAAARIGSEARNELGDLSRAFDATVQSLAERKLELQQAEHRLKSITDNLPVLISYIDSGEHMTFVNETYRRWMGVDPVRMLGRPISEVLGPELYEQRREALHRALRGERVELEVVSRGLGVDRTLHNTYIPDVRADGSVAGIYGLSADITALKEVERQLAQLARVDSLTGLPNRRQFEELFHQAAARSRRSERAMALMFLDIDHFKSINDGHGHGVGDAVLKVFAARLQECVRVTDTVARLAGDEFVIVLEGLHEQEEAALVARKIGERMREPVRAGDKTLQVTTSIGVALCSGHDAVLEDVIAMADDALYQAKRAGRARHAISAAGVRAMPAVPAMPVS